MTKQAQFWALAAALVALAALYSAGPGAASDEKETRDAVGKIADALRKGDKDGAVKLAGALAQNLDSVEEAMDLFKLRKKGGFGVGKAGSVTPDGIELKLLALDKRGLAAAALANEAAALEEMAYRIAAVAEVARLKPPARDEGKKLKKNWLSWAEDMKAGSLKLAEAAQTKTAAGIKTAAAKIVAACNACHGDFR